ncbi:MAG: N-acetylmuramoyl-L-alanine amidase, partial [Mailhella sp.]
MREINKIIIHCSATKPTQDIGAAEIDMWHKKQGWDEIGYHFVIRRNGETEKGRDIEIAGAHCKGQNKNSIGICLAGGIDENGRAENNFTDKQFQSLRNLAAKLKKE